MQVKNKRMQCIPLTALEIIQPVNKLFLLILTQKNNKIHVLHEHQKAGF